MSSSNHTFIYVQNFLRKQVEVLNQPIKITNTLRDIVSSSDISNDDLKQVLLQVNNRITTQNKTLYTNEIHQQIIRQVLKLEKQKMSIISQLINKIYLSLQPIIVPNFSHLSHTNKREKLIEFVDLIDELPDEKYLFISKEEIVEEDFDLSQNPIDEEDEEIDIHVNQQIAPDQESRNRKQDYLNSIMNDLGHFNQPDDELIQKYSDLKNSLSTISKQLKHKYDKLNYLQELQSDISETMNLRIEKHLNEDELYDSDEIDYQDEMKGVQNNLLNNDKDNSVITELNKFRILMEKLSYQVNSNDLSGTDLRDKIMEINKQNY